MNFKFGIINIVFELVKPSCVISERIDSCASIVTCLFVQTQFNSIITFLLFKFR